jgi:hydroxyethylthiazole kinase
MDPESLAQIITSVRERRPLIHHITNFVTVNDCANITLAIGAAPVMAEAHEEVEEMVSCASALVLNIGTLSADQVRAMLLAGRKAGEIGIPVILDPVGAGATAFRTESARRILDSVRVSVLKGNAGEIAILAGMEGKVLGVDSAGVNGNPEDIARSCARSFGCTVIMTGPVDIVTDGARVAHVENGHPMMGCISGTGCMAASVTGSCAAVSRDVLVASCAALAAFGIAGERAAEGAAGPGSFKLQLFDELARLTPAEIAECAKVRTVA